MDALSAVWRRGGSRDARAAEIPGTRKRNAAKRSATAPDCRRVHASLNPPLALIAWTRQASRRTASKADLARYERGQWT